MDSDENAEKAKQAQSLWLKDQLRLASDLAEVCDGRLTFGEPLQNGVKDLARRIFDELDPMQSRQVAILALRPVLGDLFNAASLASTEAYHDRLYGLVNLLELFADNNHFELGGWGFATVQSFFAKLQAHAAVAAQMCAGVARVARVAARAPN